MTYLQIYFKLRIRKVNFLKLFLIAFMKNTKVLKALIFSQNLNGRQFGTDVTWLHMLFSTCTGSDTRIGTQYRSRHSSPTPGVSEESCSSPLIWMISAVCTVAGTLSSPRSSTSWILENNSTRIISQERTVGVSLLHTVISSRIHPSKLLKCKPIINKCFAFSSCCAV